MNVEKKQENIYFPAVALELMEMYEADQKMRERWENGDYSDDNLDKIHTDRLKQIVSEIGWPTTSKVGQQGASNAWLLIQHADHDVDFQARCLQLMKDAQQSEVNITDIAYLEDRVRVNQGKGQLYGTQFTQEDGRHIPRTIENESMVDTRRAEIGMGPLSEQIQDMYDKYPFEQKK